MNAWQRRLATPLGVMLATTDGVALLALDFDRPQTIPARPDAAAARVLDDVGRWLDRYFAAIDEPFPHPLQPAGTPFQRAVWEALQAIRYGTTASYGDIARRIGRPSAVRAVGAANARNPIAIVIPCHRVIGTDGTLTGYAGGLARKQALLALERRAAFALVA
jgi:methylated-DNA-[protein]-cysteine S-methyltransferase